MIKALARGSHDRAHILQVDRAAGSHPCLKRARGSCRMLSTYQAATARTRASLGCAAGMGSSAAAARTMSCACAASLCSAVGELALLRPLTSLAQALRVRCAGLQRAACCG